MYNIPMATVAFQNEEASWLVDIVYRSLSVRCIHVSVHAAMSNTAFLMKCFIQVIRYSYVVLNFANNSSFLFPWPLKTN